MPADFYSKQGDGGPAWTFHLTYPDGSDVDLTGANVSLVMRSLRSVAPIVLTGQLTVTVPIQGRGQYVPTPQDTAIPGNYMANWIVNFPNTAAPVTLPTDGYLWIEIQPNLTSEPQQLVSLPEVKQWLRIDATQRDYDAELLGLIEAVQPLIEAVTGPILPKTYDEWYDGGSTFISLRHRPSFGYGTSPLLTIIGASEYIGPIEWPMALIPSPDQGQIYSAMLNPATGTLTRRTAGGGISAWQPGRDQVHVVYQSGQYEVPHNVRNAVTEIARAWFRTTAPTGSGFEALADKGTPQLSVGWLFERYAKEMLAPTRKFPSLA